MATGLAADIVKKLLDLLKGANISAEEKQLLKDCAADAVRVRVAVFSGEMSKAKGAAENRQIDAQVKTIASIGGGRVSKLFWSAVSIAEDGVLAAIAVV